MRDQIQSLLLGGHPLFYGIVFVSLLLCGLGFPMSADLILLTGGYLAFAGKARLVYLIPTAMTAVLLSDTLMFLIGSGFGAKLLKAWPLSKVLTAERIAAAECSFQKSGYRYIFTARFLPGLRTVVFFTGGMLRLNYSRFILFDFAGACITIPGTLIAVGLVAGNVERVLAFLKKFQTAALIAVGVFVAGSVASRLVSASRRRSEISQRQIPEGNREE
ncbi:MAG: DedA family protein [Methylotenera sp.]|nr:DedA family protein [Oligoflexia bacterium]